MSGVIEIVGTESDDTKQLVLVNSNGELIIAPSIYGGPPENRYLEFVGTVGTNDNDVVYPSPDVSMYNIFMFTTTGTNAVIDVEISFDGTNYIRVPIKYILNDGSTVTVVDNALDVPSGGIGVLMTGVVGKYKNVRLLQKGANAANAYGAHGVV